MDKYLMVLVFLLALLALPTVQTAGGNVSGSGFTTSEYTYLFQGHSTEGAWPQGDSGGGNNCPYESDGCVVSYVPRSGTASSRQYSLEGWQINQNSPTPSTVGPNSAFPVGNHGWHHRLQQPSSVERDNGRNNVGWNSSVDEARSCDSCVQQQQLSRSRFVPA